MQSITYLLPLLAALSPALAAPSKIAARQASTCAQYTPVTSGAYSVQNDAWGSGSGTGSQCAQIDGLKGNTLSWSTSFTWQGGANQVKTYANAEAAGQTPCKALNSYSTIPTTWDWTYVSYVLLLISKTPKIPPFQPSPLLLFPHLTTPPATPPP